MNETKNALTDFLNQIGDEQVAICIDGQPKVVSRTEALARKMYVMAMGGFSEEKDEDGQVVKVFHKPDYRVAKMIREFTEGKAAAEPAPEGTKKRKPGSFDSSVSNRLSNRLNLKRPKAIKGTQNGV